LYFTDIRRSFWLNPRPAFVCALIAVAICAWEASRLESDLRLFALANLLLYLQAILLLHLKSPRIYWQLALLSLMQTLVASALNDRMEFAILLGVYFAAGIVSMTAFLLFREGLSVTAAATSGGGSPWPQLVTEEHGAAGDVRSLAAARPGEEATAFSLLVWTSSAPEEVPAGLLAWSLVRQVARIGLVTALLTSGMFLAVPRIGETSWNRPGAEEHRTAGLNERVSLGELGELSEDAAVIMQICLFHHETGQEYELRDTLYLRASMLTHYDGGSWRGEPSTGDVQFEGRAPRTERELVEQWITIEPLDTDVLPAIFPVYPMRETSDVLYDGVRERLSRPLRTRSAQVNYRLLTGGLRDGRHLPIVAGGRPHQYWSRLTDSQRQALPGLQSQAAEVVQDIPAGDVCARAVALENHLRTSGVYQYSFRGEAVPENVDPIEDFVVRARQGNCEFFASALVLMLRSQGIPARLVVGFKGGAFNPLGRFYQVQQLHTHTWVEVHLNREQVPAELADDWAGRGWLRLDPTPASDETAAATAAQSDDLPTFQECVQYVRFLWINYVVRLDSEKQREAIYKPILQAVAGSIRGLTDVEAWAAFGHDVKEFLAGRGGLPLDWRGGLVASMLALSVGLAARRINRLGGRLRRRSDQAAAAGNRPEPPGIPFYDRLEELLRPRLLVRSSEQTQREFALAAAANLAERPETRAVATLPRLVAEAFYRVRFGGEALDSAESERVEHALGALAAAFAPTANPAVAVVPPSVRR